ncbi:MAG: hypothetical protein JJE22_18480 [Bacteroidia bacterium]|nr:hypothetical protein [Bacteroidia bacterium]
MEPNQPPPIPPSAPSTTFPAATAIGVFGTKIPSSIAFIIGVLLFFMPFIDIKCNNMSLQQVSGFQLATGFQMKNNSSGNSFMNDFKSPLADEEKTKDVTKTDKKDPNLFALVALGLGVLGLLLSFTNAKAGIGVAMVTGILGTAALIGLMIDVKRKAKIDTPDMGGGSGEDVLGLNKIGKQVTDGVGITVDFTAWYYVAVIAFIAAAFFCYKRMQTIK